MVQWLFFFSNVRNISNLYLYFTLLTIKVGLPLTFSRTNTKNISSLYFCNFALLTIIVRLFLTFSFFDLTLLSFFDATLLSYEFNLSAFVPIMIYHNADSDKLRILAENKGKCGIYMWTHNESGRIYIGSAADLSKRLKVYFNINFLNRYKSMYIYKALLLHGYSSFSLTIIEYIDISSLSKDEARELILEREQYYFDLGFSGDKPNIYNILKIAGSSLGFNHSKESLAKISGENNHMFGKTHTTETKNKMSLALTGRDHPNFGKKLSIEAKAVISEGMKGKNTGKLHSAETKNKMSLAKKGIKKSIEHKEKISIACKGLNLKKVFVYSNDPVSNEISLFKIFDSCSAAAKEFNVRDYTISRYLDKNKLFQVGFI